MKNEHEMYQSFHIKRTQVSENKTHRMKKSKREKEFKKTENEMNE